MAKVSNSILSRVYLLFGISLFLGVLIILRVMGLQLMRDKWVQKGIDEKVFFKKIVADRGTILSEKGEILAASLPFYRIGMDPTVLDTTKVEFFRDSLKALSCSLALKFDDTFIDTLVINDTVKIPYERKDTLKYYRRVREAMKERDRHIYLTRKVIDFNELKEIKKWPVLNLGRYRGGLVVEKIHNKRYYPFGDLARITLGSMMHDTLGIRGIEASYNKILRGRDGYILAQKVAGDTYIPLDKYGEEESVDGMDVHTTLDVDLQEVVERALERGVDRFSAKSGTAILLEVETGKIKALANWPETYNYAVAQGIEPGSTFKLASVTAAIEDGLIDLTDTIDTGEGKAQYDDWEISDDAAYGKIPLTKVFARSSNVGVSKLVFEGYTEEPQKFLDHLDRFGFDQAANNQLVGEPEPVVFKPGDESWNITTLPSMAYGYSLKVTPIQMAAFYNAIANNGKRMRPWLVTEIRKNAKTIERFGPEVMQEQICSPTTIEKVNTLLQEVVNKGTAKDAFRNMPFQVAGKTGTVRKNIGGKYVKIYRASFGGFFPAEDPRFTCYIMVDEPKGKRIGGGSVAAPIFREIAEEIYRMDKQLAQKMEKRNERPVKKPFARRMNRETSEVVYAQLGMETSGVPESEWVKASTNKHQINFKEYDPGVRFIPNMIGMSARDAMHMLEQMEVDVRLIGTGRVRRQDLQPGYIIGKQTTISLYLR